MYIVAPSECRERVSRHAHVHLTFRPNECVVVEKMWVKFASACSMAKKEPLSHRRRCFSSRFSFSGTSVYAGACLTYSSRYALPLSQRYNGAWSRPPHRRRQRRCGGQRTVWRRSRSTGCGPQPGTCWRPKRFGPPVSPHARGVGLVARRSTFLAVAEPWGASVNRQTNV